MQIRPLLIAPDTFSSPYLPVDGSSLMREEITAPESSSALKDIVSKPAVAYHLAAGYSAVSTRPEEPQIRNAADISSSFKGQQR